MNEANDWAASSRHERTATEFVVVARNVHPLSRGRDYTRLRKARPTRQRLHKDEGGGREVTGDFSTAVTGPGQYTVVKYERRSRGPRSFPRVRAAVCPCGNARPWTSVSNALPMEAFLSPAYCGAHSVSAGCHISGRVLSQLGSGC